MKQEGLVIASHGRHVVVESEDGSTRICHPRSKRNEALVGDHVFWQASRDEGTVESVLPRRNVLYRQDEIRTKSFAANIDQVILLFAAEPEFSEMQLSRALIACAAAGIEPMIVLNKQDLKDSFARGWQRMQAYRAVGYWVMPMSLVQTQALNQLFIERLHARISLILGPSGSGKSSLINRLVPQAQVTTDVISKVLNSGKHTTTSTRLHWVDRPSKTALIDSPGFQAFGLHHVKASNLANLMPDLHAHAEQCRFYNCSHLHEPGCGVKQALDNQLITASRYRIYEQLFAELSQPVF